MSFLLRFVIDRYKTLEMYDKVIIENGGILIAVSYSNEDKKICNKDVDNYAHAL